MANSAEEFHDGIRKRALADPDGMADELSRVARSDGRVTWKGEVLLLGWHALGWIDPDNEGQHWLTDAGKEAIRA